MRFSVLRGCVAFIVATFAAVGIVGSLGLAAPAGAAPEFGSQVAATQWTQTNPPLPPGGTGYDNQVSCVSSTFCMAALVQYTSDSDAVPQTAVQVWNGATWSNEAIPTPSGTTEVEIGAVSCTSISFCTAVGYGENTNVNPTPTYPIVDQWNGTTWSASTAATLPSAYSDSDFVAVSCTGPSWCMATGEALDSGSGVEIALAELWNGSTWSLSTTPALAGEAQAILAGISCTGPTNCMAVGFSSTENDSADRPGPGAPATPSFLQAPAGSPIPGLHPNATSHVTLTDQTLAELWNGSTWTVTPTPDPSGIEDPALESVSCAGTGFCMATGGLEVGGVFAAVWSGGVWTQSPFMATPGGSSDFIDGVSCISPTSCTTVGEATTGTYAGDYLSANWNGSAWSYTTVPPPPGETEAAWVGVSCLSGGYCVATGAVANGSEEVDNTIPSNAQAPIGRTGYRLAASDGGVFSYGPTAPSLGAPFAGSMGGQHLNAPIVGTATVPSGDGYYLVASDGGVFNFGSAQFYGSAGGTHLNAPIVGMAVTADGGGYWLVASDGGVFSYGDAQFYGSTGGLSLNKPIVGIAATPNGLGYFLVASDGGIFNYGNAVFDGSMGGKPLNKPIVGMAVAASGGYYLVGSDGGVFNFGAPLLGSAGSLALNKPVVGIGVALGGYYLVASDGGVFSYPVGGPSPLFFGSAGGTHLNAPIVGIGT